MISAAVVFDNIESADVELEPGEASWSTVRITAGQSRFCLLMVPTGAAEAIAAAINATLMPPEQPLKQRTPELVDEPTTFFGG